MVLKMYWFFFFLFLLSPKHRNSSFKPGNASFKPGVLGLSFPENKAALDILCGSPSVQPEGNALRR